MYYKQHAIEMFSQFNKKKFKTLLVLVPIAYLLFVYREPVIDCNELLLVKRVLESHLLDLIRENNKYELMPLFVLNNRV